MTPTGPTAPARSRFFLALLMLLMALPGMWAQTLVSGRITDRQGLPLEGVNVFEPTSYAGAVTDSAGDYSFTAFAKTPFTVRTQYIGYRVDSVRVLDTLGAPISFRLRPTATSLSEAVVTAGAFVASDTRKTAVLSSVDVATTGAQADIAEALSTLPGSTPAGETGQLLVRGGSAAETQGYINGMRVPNLYTSRLPDVPSRTRFSPFGFKGITFATGGFSAAYGDALSGALILQTSDKPNKSLTQISVLSLGADVARTQVLPHGQAVALSVGGMHLGAYAALNPEAGSTLTTVPQGLNAQAAYWWTGSDGRNLKVMGQAATQHFARTAPEEAKFYGANSLGLDNQNVYAQAVYQQPRGTQGLWTFGSSVAANRDVITVDGTPVALDQVDLQSRVEYADNYQDLALWRVGAESNWRRQRVDAVVGDPATTDLTPVASVDQPYTATFVEADWYLSRRWMLRTGLRADAYTNDSAGEGSWGAMRVSPRTQLSYVFSPSHQLAVSAGQYVQRQTNDSLFARNHQLAPAALDYYGLTYSRTAGGRILRVEAYAKTYRDLFSIDAGTRGFATQGEGYARGVDVFYRDRTSIKNMDFWISYSITDAARRQGTLREVVPVPFAAANNVAVVAKRFFPKQSFGINATYRFHSGRPYNDPNSARRFGGITPDFHDLSLNATYLTQVGGHFTVIFASLTNVAGARQVNQYRFSQEPSAATGRFDRLDVDPLLPKFPFIGAFISLGDTDRKATIDDI